MRKVLAVLSLLVVALVIPLTASAQIATVQRNVNLRVDPSTDEEPILLLEPPAVVSVLDSGAKTGGYYHVVTQNGEEGWVWSRNVKLDMTTPPATPPVTTIFHGCPPEGNAIPQWVKDINVLKNRTTVPAAGDFDSAVTLAQVLQTGDDTTRFSTGKAAELTGFVHEVKVGGIETANCRDRTKEGRDTHIEVVLSAGDSGPKRRVIVEVTPRWREHLAATGIDWSTDGLKAKLEGHNVRFRGWLLFDREHADESENTKPGRAANWRATAWELHPLTNIEILP